MNALFTQHPSAGCSAAEQSDRAVGQLAAGPESERCRPAAHVWLFGQRQAAHPGQFAELRLRDLVATLILKQHLAHLISLAPDTTTAPSGIHLAATEHRTFLSLRCMPCRKCAEAAMQGDPRLHRTEADAWHSIVARRGQVSRQFGAQRRQVAIQGAPTISRNTRRWLRSCCSSHRVRSSRSGIGSYSTSASGSSFCPPQKASCSSGVACTRRHSAPRSAS